MASKKQIENYKLYRRFGKLDCGIPRPDMQLCNEGVGALEAFAAMDAKGISLPCREPDALAECLQGKARLNMHIKMWAEDVARWQLFSRELREWHPYLPAWVFTAVERQAQKIRYAEVA